MIIDPAIKKEVMGIGINKVYRILYEVRSISELTDSQILNIIDQVMEKAYDMLIIDQKQNHVIKNFKPEVNAPTILMLAKVNISTVPIYLTYVSNSSDLINSPVISYDACASYINITLKEYPYLFLYNSDRHNNAYEFKNLGLYPRCKKEHNKEKVVD